MNDLSETIQRFGSLKRCKPNWVQNYGQFMTFIQQYINNYDLVFNVYFLCLIGTLVNTKTAECSTIA